MSTIITNIINPALNACWSWFTALFNSMPGALGFFLAIFTFGCVIRFLVMPLLGQGMPTSRSEETPQQKRYNEYVSHAEGKQRARK